MPMEVPTTKHLGFSFTIALLVVLAVHFADFKGSVPNFRERSGGGVLLDIKPSFSQQELYERLEAYGDEGRRIYSFRNVTVDVVLPLALLHFLFPFTLRAHAALGLARFPKGLLLFFPIAYLAFDLAENAVVLRLLSRFPERVHYLAAALPYLTVIKRLASILAVVIPPILFAIAWLRRRHRWS
jgi:hypothetical protein